MEIEYRGFKISIENEEPFVNPRDWTEISKMICFHSRYDLGDCDDYNQDDYSSWEELKKTLEKDFKVVIPLYLYDHSGITMSTKPFSCSWDSGQVGYICASAEEIRKTFGVKRITKKIKEKVVKILKTEVSEYDGYISGEGYCYDITDKDGNEISSGGGYLGDWNETGIIDDAKADIDSVLKHQ